MTTNMIHPCFLNFEDGQQFCFRQLGTSDAHRLGKFFLSLSADTQSKFGPHPLTEAHARYLCETIETDQALRIITCDADEITGYFILDFAVYPEEELRYREYGICLEPQTAPVFALCIADKYQGSGVASKSMPHIIKTANALAIRRIVLMGGTQQRNTHAIAFYRNFGFKEMGRFYTDHNQLNNLDMMLSLGCESL